MAASSSGLHLQILGPLRVWRDGVELDAGPRQQAYLLALLIARAGQPISREELIDLVWDDDAPASARNVLHKYVGALRRLLEPGLPARSAGSYLLRRGDGYLFAAGADELDVVSFRELVRRAGALVAGQRDEAALDCYVDALRHWQGSAGAGQPHGSHAMPTFAGLDAEFAEACVAATELAVVLGQAERVLPALRLAAATAPLHEPVHAALMSALRPQDSRPTRSRCSRRCGPGSPSISTSTPAPRCGPRTGACCAGSHPRPPPLHLSSSPVR